MDVTVRTTKHDLVASGSVIVPYGEYVDFEVKGLIFRMTFESDENAGNARVQPELVEDENGQVHYMAVKCYNFNGSLHSIMNSKLVLAQTEGRALSLQFSVSSFNKRHENGDDSPMIEDMLVTYSWYLAR